MFPAIRAPADRSRPQLLGFASCPSPHFICAYLPRICQVSPVHRAFPMRSVRSGQIKVLFRLQYYTHKPKKASHQNMHRVLNEVYLQNFLHE